MYPMGYALLKRILKDRVMGASFEDVNLIIIHQGQKTYWSGMKSCGHVLLDLRFGLFSEDPKPDLSWISKTIWAEMLEPLDAPLEDPVYGELIVDFDRRVIIEGTGYGSPFTMYPQWLALTWEDRSVAPLAKKSLVEHLAKQRVKLGSVFSKGGEAGGPSETLNAKYKAATSRVNEAREFKIQGVDTVFFDMPAGWSMEGVE